MIAIISAASIGRLGRCAPLTCSSRKCRKCAGKTSPERCFYKETRQAEVGISAAEQLQGKALSYNNVADTDAALECVKTFDEPACNREARQSWCGWPTTHRRLRLRLYTDTESAPGAITFNRELDGATAAAIVERQFVEVIIAPEVSATLSRRSQPKKCACYARAVVITAPARDFKRVNGGLLLRSR